MAVILGSAVIGGACLHRAPELVPVADAQAPVARARALGTPDSAFLIEFQWTYRGREGRFSGEGGLRINPPDSVRLDLFGPGWSGVQSAVLVEDAVVYVGEQRVRLPPPTFLWAMFGIFKPPEEATPEAFRRGDRSVLGYRLSMRERVLFEFDTGGRLLEAELREGERTMQTIRLERADARAAGRGWQPPAEARFRHIREFHEVRVEVREARRHEAFKREIFEVVAR